MMNAKKNKAWENNWDGKTKWILLPLSTSSPNYFGGQDSQETAAFPKVRKSPL